MAEPGRTGDPRWGQVGRDRKAEAILRTVELCVGTERDVRNATWLDVGCGSGGVAATLAAHVDNVIGVDPESWDRWQAFESQHPNLKLLRGSYRDLETLCGPASVDVVVCNQVYEHVDDPRALLAAIHTVLKPEGMCYFAGPNLLWPIEPHVVWPFVHWLPRSFAQRCMRVLGSQRAARLDAWSWSYWRLTRRFRMAGFIYANALLERANVAIIDKHPRSAGVVRQVPCALVDVVAPFSPGFVFVLRRHGA